jgi:YidC/Oxa1 family membrane protein insertase
MAYNFLYYGPKLKRTQELQRAQQEQLELDQAANAAKNAIEEPGVSARTPGGAFQPSDSVATTRGYRGTDTASEQPGTASGQPALDPVGRSVFTVATPLFEIRLSSDGAKILSATLLKYETDDIPVQLIRQDDPRGLLGMRLVGENRSLPLSGMRFVPYQQGWNSPINNGATIRLDDSSEPKTVAFRATTPDGHNIERYYTFNVDSYTIRSGVRFVGSDFAYARNVEWSFGAGLQATETNQSEDNAAMKATVRLGDEFHKKKRSDFNEEFSGTVQWASLKTKYFTALLFPDEPTGGVARLEGIKDENYMTAAIELPFGGQRGAVDHGLDVYIGPLDYDVLKKKGRGLEKNVEIGFDHVKIFQPVSRGILWSMLALYKIIPNYGIVILLISVLTKVLFYRLTHKSFKSMRDMQNLQPKLAALKEKHKEDRQKLSQETMKLYKESGVNPLGGCLPMLFQMPVFLALFNVLRNTIEIRRAPFFGWINDLSQQDVLFSLPFSLPVIGSAFSVLPILMGGSMLLQSKIGGSIAGPESSATQPKMMTYMLPIVFTFLFYKMPSGLVLYWLVNTVLSVGQQYYINKGAPPHDDPPDAGAVEPKATEEKPPAKPAAKRPARPKRKPKTKKG